MAKDAMRKREKAAEKRREAEEAWIKDEIDAHSFDDLKDEDIDKTELRHEVLGSGASFP